ncbi:hypothetical protein F4775DRAFT_541868 [Biscogniauxia sp. FL1348]|nr:hypothetical protein F4775DRAFT_541868 [Biscogniauxia sp. FL1348]
MPPSKFKSFFGQYYPPKPTFTEADLTPDSHHGRVFIVTGGNAGIGFQLCKLLITTGATIYMASRSKEKAEAAIKTISDSIPLDTPGRGHIKFLHYDLNDLNVVQEAAKEFAQQESKLDILWNNAGTGGNAVKYGERTKQGFEPLIGMHCIATLLFTELMRPFLQAAAAGSSTPGATRVLWLTTNLVDTNAPPNGLDFSMLDRGYKDGAKNYAVSKAGTWILGREFGARYGKDGILSLTVNPGVVRGGSYAGTPRVLMAILDATMMHDTVYGAYTELYAGLSPDLKPEDYKNLILPWGRVCPIDIAWRQDIAKAMKPESEGGLGYGQKLWEWCEEQWKPHVQSTS